MKRTWTLLLLFLVSLPLDATGLDYLNTLRQKAGLVPFASHSALAKAAEAHSRYLQLHDASGHVESAGEEGFTGENPWDRAVNAGYPSRYVSENVSSGQRNVEASIDGLMSAIYHRFGFLSLESDQVGIGISDDGRRYTYNMGNAGVAALCEADDYRGGSYYRGVCADAGQKVEADRFLEAVDGHKDEAPALILWPPVDGEKIPPAFYEESPDPLPDHGVTGYPVSVRFNDAKFDEPPTLESFTLTDEGGDAVEILTVMESRNDPNGKFSGYEYALFPKKRLEWGSVYRVELAWSDGDTRATKSWCFATRSLNEFVRKVYRVEDDDTALEVVSGRTYALYMVPSDTNDAIRGYSYRYTASGVSLDFIDPNTFAVTVTGDAGESVEITFSNDKKVKLTLADSDTAALPKARTCGQSPAGDGTGTPPGEEEEAASQTQDDRSQPAPTDDAAPTSGASWHVDVEDEPGVYRPVEGGYVVEEAGSRISVQVTAAGQVRYEVVSGGRSTVVTLPAEGSSAAIDRTRTGTLRAGGSGVTVTVHPDGGVELRGEGMRLPRSRLPAGTLLTIDARHIRAVVPVADTIAF